MLLESPWAVKSVVKIVVLGVVQALVLMVARPLVKEHVKALAKGVVPMHVHTFTTNKYLLWKILIHHHWNKKILL